MSDETLQFHPKIFYGDRTNVQSLGGHVADYIREDVDSHSRFPTSRSIEGQISAMVEVLSALVEELPPETQAAIADRFYLEVSK